jgi:hypothetical protein
MKTVAALLLLALPALADEQVVQTQDFTLTVPEGWTTKTNADSTEFGDPKGKEQIPSSSGAAILNSLSVK